MINIGKDIYTLITSDSTINNIINNKLYPIIIPENVENPVVVYERTGNKDYNKDSSLPTATIELTILADSYAESLNIASAIDNLLDGYSGTVNDTLIRNCRLINVVETYADDTYFQKLTYQFKTN